MLNADYKYLETKYNELRIKTKEIVDILLDDKYTDWYRSAIELFDDNEIDGFIIQEKLKELKSII